MHTVHVHVKRLNLVKTDVKARQFLEVVRQNHTLGEKKPESQVAIKQWSVFKIFPHHSFEENIQGNNVNQPGSNFQNLMEPKETNIQKY